MSDGTPARIDRAALERIIQRAAELQTGEREIGEELTPDEVLALGPRGRHSGTLPPAGAARGAHPARRRAGPAGPGRRLAGPAQITAQRVVRGERGRSRRTLVRWLEENELFSVQRQQPGRITWEPLGGFQAAIRRATAAFGRGQAPDHARPGRHGVAPPSWRSSRGTATSRSRPTTRKARGESVGGGAAFAAAGVVGSGVLAGAGRLPPGRPAPGAGRAGPRLRHAPALSARSLARIQLGLERALDQLEHGEPPRSGSCRRPQPGCWICWRTRCGRR